MKQILSRGDTPAGSHRSIMVPEIIEILSPRPGDVAIDATLGYGGHAREILKGILPCGRLYGFDRDPEELRKTAERLWNEVSKAGITCDCFFPVRGNFSALPDYLGTIGVSGVDIVIADLGLSSMQIDNPERGFSFKQKGPLDMRMDTEKGLSAREFLAGVSEDRLRDILVANADETMASEIARAICLRRGKLNTTRDLAEAICSVFPHLVFKDPEMARTLRRCFQAIRIEVNAEFASLETLLASLPSCLNPGGRVVILCFHSGEDRRVEDSFRKGHTSGLYSAIAEDPVRPGHRERYENPRSASAKMRWAIRS